MREPCRVCGVCVLGGQCRWLFSTCGRLRLAVVLSHVLGCELYRDGRSEFLCCKCVFLLERVVQSDVTIGSLKETHAAQLQRLCSERDGLCALITHKYHQNNLQGSISSAQPKHHGQEHGQLQENEARSGLEFDKKTAKRGSNQHSTLAPQQQSQTQNQLKRQRNETTRLLDLRQKQQQRQQGRRLSSEAHQATRRGGPGTGQLRRCVSLEPLSGASTERSSSFGRSLSARKSRDVGFKAAPMLGAGAPSQSREYLNLVHRRSTLTSRSVSLQSLTEEHQDYGLLKASSRRPTRPRQRSSTVSLETSSQVSDLLQLLRSAKARPLPQIIGSRIPVLTQLSSLFGHAHICGARSVKVERALRELEEEFNDEYLPLKQEVH
ncbi:uncharacterized protein [Hoplias malabaricus]|uniref:uncharacterized protein n=1 Tax=Hoplias malabaricus TaxID=27720 RepID=UPI003462B95D